MSAAGNDLEPKPRPLHKTQSIFLRNLVPTITHQEVEAVCSLCFHLVKEITLTKYALLADC